MQSPNRRAPAGRLLRVLEILGWTAFFVFAAVFLLLRFWLLPQVERYQGHVVAALTGAVGLPVTIGALRADWEGLHPRLEVTDLRIYDRDGREALALPSVEPVVGWASLLAGDLRLYSLTIDGPRLTVRRGADGVLSVAGVALAAGAGTGGGDGRLADWILGQREIIIRDAEIDWVDELRGAPPLTLRSVQFRLRNRGDVHQIGLSARPPPELGAGVELRASLIGRSVAVPAAWNGRIYAELGYTDLAGWRAWFDYPVEVTSGQGAIRLWATFGAGKLVDATADLALSGVAARLGTDLPELRLASVAGRVQGRGTALGYEFGTRRLALVPVDGLAMHGTTFRASWEATAPPRGTLSADLIELAPLAQLAEFLPFPADLRALLVDLAPQGRISDAAFEWRGKLPDDARFKGRARLDGITMSAWRAIPGFANLSGRIDASGSKGVLVLAARDAEIALPRLFPEPRIRLAQLSGEVRWERRAPGGVNVRIAGLQFANEDLAGGAAGTYSYTGDGPGTIDLTARLQRADARGLPKYLPRPEIMGQKPRDWLQRAIRAGQSADVRLRLLGDLRHFPFTDPQLGQFQVVAQVRNGVLAYAEGWPPIEGIDGELRFERADVEMFARRANVFGATLSDTRAEMTLRAPVVLKVSGDAEGPSAEFLEFVRRSPLRRTLGEFSAGLSAAGRGRLRLELQLPIADTAKTTVSGQYVFAGNSLQIDAGLPQIERAAGTLAFTESSIQVRNASGRFLGGPLRVIGGTRRGGGVVLGASGTFTVNGLGPLIPEPWRRSVRGAAAYAGSVRLARGAAPQIALESNLVGVASELPAPLAKQADQMQLLRVAILQGAGGERGRVSITLGRVLRAEVLRQLEGEDLVERAAIAFYPVPGARLRFPERPTRTLLYGSLQHLDVDQWRALLEQTAAGGGAGATAVDMSIGTLDAFGKRMLDISVKAQLGDGEWTANLNSKDIAGDVTYRTKGEAKLLARMARFDVPPDVPGVAARAARELPAVDLVADDFGFRGKRFGRVEIVARREDSDWRVEKLSMQNPEGSVSGDGLWRTAPAPRTTFNFDLQSSDVGRFLDRIGYPNLVGGGKASAKVALAWDGEPAAIDYASLSGKLQLHAEDGHFREIDPGIGKLISLMSLQMLPRRITLDFRDVFSKGFQWNSIDATATIDQGVLQTRDFKMSGGAAAVTMQGQVNLASETQDLRVRVVPALDSTASTVAGMLVNPAVGLGTFLAQKLLQNPLGQIFAFEYGITGGWTDPKVEKLAAVPVEALKPPAGD
ncbi:MAG: YhdP family protein [Betaproteobacteria bacterium]|nr:YhdP family protein [Betaproteobacteria bacterium]